MESALPPADLAQSLADQLTRAAERVFGARRARELAPSIRATTETLALVAANEVAADDEEPDFVRSAEC